MQKEELDAIVEEFRTEGFLITDEEAANVIKLCRRKIELTKQEPEYMRLLLPDELKNYCFRRGINAITMLRQLERECGECAVCV